MRKENSLKKSMHIAIATATGLALCFAALTDAAAQRRGGFGGPQLSPEKAEAAWNHQADSASIAAKLDKEQSGKVSEAYVAARKSQQAAISELFNSGERGPGRFQAFRELNTKEAAKLSESLNSFLSEEQTTQAMASLGTFSGAWDRYVDVLSGFEFEGKGLYPALLLLQTYAIDTDKAMREAMANQDFQSMRSSRTALKAKLDSGLAEMLSEEQLAEWKTKTVARGRGGR